MEQRFDGMTGLVTGGARGIGFAIAQHLLSRGAQVWLNDVDPKALDLAIEELKSFGEVHPAPGDVTSSDSVDSVVDAITEESEGIDILVNNAGASKITPAEEISDVEWDRMLAIGRTAAFYVSRSVAKKSMIPNSKGRIVNIGSMGSLAAVPGLSHFVAAKHGVLGLTKAHAIEWARHSITVNCVCPGVTVTPQFEATVQANPEMMEGRKARVPLGRLAQPSDIANAVGFLVAPASGYISGQVLWVDGGMYALFSGYGA